MPAYQQAPTSGRAPANVGNAADVQWVRRIADVVNLILKGKLNAVLQVTLRPGQSTTTISDARITASSALHLQPLTSHAAAALATSPYVLPTSQNVGSVTFTHANDANTDKTFNMTIVG